MATWGPTARVLGLMHCEECGCERAFITADAHVKHITDAECEHCRHVYGRYDEPTTRRGEVDGAGEVKDVVRKGHRSRPVISDAVAAEAADRWRDRLATQDQLAEAPPPVPTMPAEGEGNDASRVQSFLRSQR